MLQYLDFALGKPLGPLEPGEPESAVGLEAVAQILTEDYNASVLSVIASSSIQATKGEESDIDPVSPDSISSLSSSDSGSSVGALDDGDVQQEGPAHH